jgi:hypothetical protein
VKEVNSGDRAGPVSAGALPFPPLGAAYFYLGFFSVGCCYFFSSTGAA